MKLYAVKTKKVDICDDLVETVIEALKKQNLHLEDNDVLAFASKIVAYAEGRVARLSDVEPSEKAEELAREFCLQPEFAELVLREADMIYGGVEKAILTLKDSILAPNAGIDSKNAPRGFVVLWPSDPKKWAEKIKTEMERKTGKRVAVLIVDSGLVPLRTGTSGLALAVAGFKPIRDTRGKKDLYGKTLIITRHAVADDLASAAHLLMGEADEKTPVVLIREAPLDFDNGVYGGSSMMMPFRECLFMGTFACGSHDSDDT